MTDTETYIHQLSVTNVLREPVMEAAIRSLELPSGSRGLDAGCGIGLQALLLAEAVGPKGRVTGLDLSPEFLQYARGIAAEAGLSERVSFRQGNINDLPFDDRSFDWVWSADCAGYVPLEPLPVLRELVRVVEPGGKLIILAWSSQQLLPGYPLLEARLNATSAGIGPFTGGMKPERNFLRALGWFRRLGLQDVEAGTFAGSVQAPLSGEVRSALAALLDMRWAAAEKEVSGEVWAEYRRLCRPESPDFILNLPDYYAFFTYSLFRGVVPVQEET